MNRRLILPFVVFLLGALALAAAAIITFSPRQQGQSGDGQRRRAVLADDARTARR